MEKVIVRFLFIIDDYMPASTRVGAKMLHELAVHFVDKGHEVVVLTPDSDIKNKLEKSTLDGVNVWRFKSGRLKDVPYVRRAINEIRLSYLGWKAIKGELKIGTSFDAVIYYSPSIFFGHLVRNLKKYSRCKSYLILRDLFPQWVIDDGILRPNSPITKFFRYFEKINYNSADVIGVMSPKNKNVFNKNNQHSNVEVLYNWASLKKTVPSNKVLIREELDLDDKVIFFYGGNIGKAQDMLNLMRLAESMLCYDNAHFLFVGQGDEYELIKRFAADKKLINTTILPSVNQEKFKEILACVDIGLFSLSKTHSAHNFPGKLLGYMNSCIPILGSVNEGNDLIEVVNNRCAGHVSVNGEDEKLLTNAIELLKDNRLREQMGSNAHELLKKEFSIESAYETIIKGVKSENSLHSKRNP